MRIGLIDVDRCSGLVARFPNLALMRISAYHKAMGDTVEWWWSDFEHYDTVYMSKVFSSAYSKDVPEPFNAGEVIKGGTGYCIRLEDGREVYDGDMDYQLPKETETVFPDYSLYPRSDFAVSMTTRGCPRNCPFCHVTQKEGAKTVKVADVSDFWNGQKVIKVLDANITACGEKRDLLRQYRETGAAIDFTQGLDIRLLDDEDIHELNQMRIKQLHFAWDNAKIDLSSQFAVYAKQARHKPHGHYGSVFVLTNFNSTQEEDLNRIYTLRDIGFDPYVPKEDT